MVANIKHLIINCVGGNEMSFRTQWSSYNLWKVMNVKASITL